MATEVLAADAALAGRDTARALALTRFYVDSVMPATAWVAAGIGIATDDNVVWKWLLVPRAMLMRADLAAATGNVEEAREWYAKVLSLWAGADPEMQPAVARIRASMAALPGRK
jgi:hypothetical protein